MLHIPEFYIPIDLHTALRNHLVDNDNLSPICSNYIKRIKNLSNVRKISYEDYFSIFEICLYLEQYKLDLEVKWHRLTDHKITTVASDECFIVNVPSANNENLVIKPDDTVIIYEAATKKRFTAKVKKVNKKENNITVRMHSTQMTKIFVSDKKFNIHFCNHNWPLRCCHYALMLIGKHGFLNLIYPQLRTDWSDSELEIEYINTNMSKNEEQKQAVTKILNKTAYPAPYIIFGPPGTGKTATLVEIICQIVKHYPMENILVCTASNAAADEITIRLIGNVPSYMIYRIYSRSRQRDSLLKDSISKKIKELIYADCIHGSIFLPMRIGKIIITTLVTSIRLTTMKFWEDHFSFIIIDEAGQATEPETLIPLTLISNEIDKTKFQTQVVIAGDPYQLGPSVHCKLAQHLLGKSMLERLINDCDPYKKRDGKYNPNYVTKLIKNYRSHKHILHVSNKRFYDNELESCGGTDTQMALNWQKLPEKSFPVIFQEVLGKEERTPNRSVYNIAEILVVMEYVRMLIGTKFEKHTVEEKDIGIITPFKQQQIQIIHKLEAEGWGKVSVGTVETFQGQERTVIILSTVRSKTFEHDGKEHIGFLSNPKRFNVAITRAKALMIIIGNPHIISKDEHWKALWEYCKKHGGYIPYEQCPLKLDLIKKLENEFKTNLDNDNNKPNMSVGDRLPITIEFGKIKTETLCNVLMHDMEQLTLTNND